MRFNIASPERVRSKAKLLKSLLASHDLSPTLTECQAAIARCLGYRDWAEMVGSQSGSPSPLDEDAGQETWQERIKLQCHTIAAAFKLSPQDAAGITLALRLTSRERSEDVAVDMDRFQPRPRRSHAPSTPVEPSQVVLHVLQWDETERGWGCRPDGFSVHGSAEEMAAYVAAYWAKMPNRIPDEYSRPCSDGHDIAFDPDSPVVAAYRAGRVRLWGREADAIYAAWPAQAEGWHRR